MTQSTTFSALLARDHVARLRAEAGRPVQRDQRRARGRHEGRIPSSPAALLPLRWIPKST